MAAGNARPTTLWRSFGHAWDGLVDAASTQRNMRIHLVAGVLATAFAAAAPLQPSERAAILLCTALVVAAEAANTALEALVNLHGGPPSEAGRVAKDAAAGAVLALAVASVLVLAVVLSAHRAEPLARWRGALPAGLAGLALATVVAVLVAPWRSSRRAAAPLAAAGVIPLTLLTGTAASPVCVAMSAALFGLAVAARFRAFDGHPM